MTMSSLGRIVFNALFVTTVLAAGTFEVQLLTSFSGTVDICLHFPHLSAKEKCNFHLPTTFVTSGQSQVVAVPFNASWVREFTLIVTPTTSRGVVLAPTFHRSTTGNQKASREVSLSWNEITRMLVKYRVICQKGMGGQLCDEHINFCAFNYPCQNKGICRNEQSGLYSCECPRGFIGRNCQLPSVCNKEKLCVNGGSCLDVHYGRDFKCLCPDGFRGTFCEEQEIPERTLREVVQLLHSSILTIDLILIIVSLSLLLLVVVVYVRIVQQRRERARRNLPVQSSEIRASELLEKGAFLSLHYKGQMISGSVVEKSCSMEGANMSWSSTTDHLDRYTTAPSNQNLKPLDFENSIYEEIGHPQSPNTLPTLCENIPINYPDHIC